MPVTPNSIITPQVPRSASGVASLANTAYGDAPAGAVLIFAAGPASPGAGGDEAAQAGGGDEAGRADQPWRPAHQ